MYDLTPYLDLEHIAFIIIIASTLFGSFIGYQIGWKSCYKSVTKNIDIIVNNKRNDLLVKGEQVGFEKGFEAGKSEAQSEIRLEIAEFLEHQAKELRG